VLHSRRAPRLNTHAGGWRDTARNTETMDWDAVTG